MFQVYYKLSHIWINNNNNNNNLGLQSEIEMKKGS